ncbi:MAG: NRDE family protein [Ferruginibacter sp.]|nr:NRDE family protein [Ferruginibacter sp.]
MCTVSFVRANEAVIITSNRDEHTGRENAAAPAFYQSENKTIIFPKDAKAGGTWFAAADDGTVAVLLNGAFKKHTASPPYRKSRGLILLEIIEAAEPLSFFRILDLDDIEPFTIVLYRLASLHELRWDGSEKHEQALDIYSNYIWSSATLYADEVIAQRKNLFEKFIGSSDKITAQSTYDFHAGNNGDTENGFVINRSTGMKTFSITQAIIQNGRADFLHADLLQEKSHSGTMQINQAAIKV